MSTQVVSQIFTFNTAMMIDQLQTKTLGEIGYQIAAEYLLQLSQTTEFSLHHALQAEECEMRLDRGKVEEAAIRTREMLSRFRPRVVEKITELLKKYGERKTNERVLTLILYHRQYEISQEERYAPADKLSWIQHLVENVRQISYDIAGEKDDTSKKLATKYGAKLVERLLNSLQNLANADGERKATILAECHFTLGNIYFRLGDYQNSARCMQEAAMMVDIDEPIADIVVQPSPDPNQASNPVRRRINLNLIKTFGGFGQEIGSIVETKCLMLWILGNSHYRMGDFNAARQYYNKTLAKLQDHADVAERWAKIVGKDLLKAVYRLGREDIDLETVLTIDVGRAEDIVWKSKFYHREDKLKAFLLVAGFEIRLARGNQEGALEEVKNTLLRDGFNSASRIRSEGHLYNPRYRDHRFPALIMQQNAFDMYLEEEHSPEETAKWICALAQDVFLASYALASENPKSKLFAETYGARFVEELLYYLHSVPEENSLDLKFAEAECVYYVANIYFRAELYRTSSLHFETAIQLYGALFQENAYEKLHYCLSLWTLGNCYFRLRQFREAEVWYEETVEAVRKSNADIRHEWLAIAQRDLWKAIYRQTL